MITKQVVYSVMLLVPIIAIGIIILYSIILLDNGSNKDDS